MLISRLNTAAAMKCCRQSRSASASTAGNSIPASFTDDDPPKAATARRHSPPPGRGPRGRWVRQFPWQGNNACISLKCQYLNLSRPTTGRAIRAFRAVPHPLVRSPRNLVRSCKLLRTRGGKYNETTDAERRRRSCADAFGQHGDGQPDG